MDLQNAFIGDIVAEDFRTAAIFKRHKIDFCCNGGRTIEAACTAKKIDPAVIYKAIEELPKGNGGDIDFSITKIGRASCRERV